MNISVGFLTGMVSIALAVTVVTPIILLVLWLRDWHNGRLW